MQFIANVAGNRQLYKKAYFIEFRNGDATEAAFSFALPPESEELTYGQRKTETKTFGGLHVDDYGVDCVKIQLSGSTVNQELKKIYCGNAGNKFLSGEEEIYHFRDLIKDYTSIDKLTDKTSNRKIILYDLSKSKFAKGSTKNIKNYWRVFPGDFKIRRSSDRPFTYKYSIEFTGIDPSEDIKVDERERPKIIEDLLNLIQSAIDEVNRALEWVDDFSERANEVFEAIHEVNDLLRMLENSLSYTVDSFVDIIDSASSTATGTINSITGLVNVASTVIKLPATITQKTLNLGNEMQKATKKLMMAVWSFINDCTADKNFYGTPIEVLKQYSMTTNKDFKDSIFILLNRAETAAIELVAAAKSSDIPDITSGNCDPKTGKPHIVLSYGDKTIVLNDADTFESLASQYLGNPDKALDIATYNGIASLSQLKPGDKIKLPITDRTQKMKNNLIFATRDGRDNYGHDILLTDDGCIIPSVSGDYALTGGENNLSQAILLRLRESVEKRIRINSYGIRTNISDPTVRVAYIVSSIELTVMSDPRVKSVDSIAFNGKGDCLYVDVIYSDINYAHGKITRRI